MQIVRITRPAGAGHGDPRVIECCGVRFTPEGVAAIESGRIVLTIYKVDVRRIILRRGSRAQHPLIQLIAGGFFFLAGLVLLTLLILPENGAAVELGMGGIFMLILGGWLVYESLRRGYFLHADTTVGWKKITFSVKAKSVDIQPFLCAARDTLGYPVEADAGDAIIRLS